MTNPNADLDDLVNEPRETLDVEVKECLDLAYNDHRALVAKEIIALANHGGGVLVVGFRNKLMGHLRQLLTDPQTWTLGHRTAFNRS